MTSLKESLTEQMRKTYAAQEFILNLEWEQWAEGYIKQLQQQMPLLKHNGIVREDFADGYNRAIIKIMTLLRGEEKP